MLGDLQRGLTILTALPQLFGFALNAVQQVDAMIPHTGVLNQKVAAVGSAIENGIRAAATGVTEIESIIPVVTGFAASILGLIEDIRSGKVPAVPPPMPGPPPAPPAPTP